MMSDGDWDEASESEDLSDFSAVADESCDVAVLADSSVDAISAASELVAADVDVA